jgi:DNA-directed RNA polymerase specialized sigma24 family protein
VVFSDYCQHSYQSAKSSQVQGRQNKDCQGLWEQKGFLAVGEEIQRAMLKLSKKEAKAIAMFGLKGLSQEKVAEIMGCSAEAVKWYVFKARQKLKLLLKEYLE